MQSPLRALVVGLAAAGIILSVTAALMLLYVEWIWFSDDANVQLGTNVLLVACVGVIGAGAIGAHRYVGTSLMTFGVMALVIIPLVAVALVVLSHNNACFGGESYPIPDQWALWGRECGR